MTVASDVNARIARRLRDLRECAALSLDALSERSGVSRSNISLIERGESSPTATVLDKLATALDVAVASMFEDTQVARHQMTPVVRIADQPVWTDPGSGYVRRNVSPPLPSPLQMVDVIFPAGARVAYETGPRTPEIHQQVWMIEGRMEVTVGQTWWQLDAGDCLAMRLDAPIVYANRTHERARYLVALATMPVLQSSRRSS